MKEKANKPLYLVFMISLSLHVLALIIFGSFKIYEALASTDATFEVPEIPPEPIEKKKFQVEIQKRQRSSSSPPPTNMIVVKDMTPNLPNVEIREVAPVTGLGKGIGGAGKGFGEGNFGDGLGLGGFPDLPELVSGRCTAADRARRLAENGGKPETEDSVLAALRWLQAQQNRDGSWGETYKGGMTGLALLAYLGHCETHTSPEFGETVKKGIRYLQDLAREKEDHFWYSSNHGAVYEHAIGTYALAEAYTLTDNTADKLRGLANHIRDGAKIIIEGQMEDGGWMYHYAFNGPGDSSVVGWQIQALKAVQLTEISVSRLKRAMQNSIKHWDRLRKANYGYDYREKEDRNGYTLAGAGALALQMIGEGEEPHVEQTVKYILNNTNFNYGNANLYAWYYNTQACFQAGGSYWEEWNAGFQDVLLRAQNDDGSWPTANGTADGHADTDAAIYRTALCTLMLEVYYRYLPLYN